MLKMQYWEEKTLCNYCYNWETEDKKINDSENGREDIYRKLLSDRLPADLGYLYENVVAQIIKASGRDLHSFFSYIGKHAGHKIGGLYCPKYSIYFCHF